MQTKRLDLKNTRALIVPQSVAKCTVGRYGRLNRLVVYSTISWAPLLLKTGRQ